MKEKNHIWIAYGILTTVICFSGFAFATPWTPFEWQDGGKLRKWVRDQNGNFVDDLIDNMTSGNVKVIVDLNACIGDPSKSEVMTYLNSVGRVAYVGKYLSFVIVDEVPVGKAEEIGSRPEVAMVELALVPIWTDLDRRALKVEDHPRYRENLQTEFHWPDDLNGRGVNIAILDSGVADDIEPDLASKFVRDRGADCMTNPCAIGNPDDITYGGDGDPHGTSMASIALGTGDYGIAPEAGLVDIRISDEAALERALELVYEMKDAWNIGIVSLALSLGHREEGVLIPDPDNGLQLCSELINFLEGHGIVVVSSAGPTSDEHTIITAPGSSSRAISVTAADPSGDVVRTNDTIRVGATGPRDSDDDQDRFDELKPEIATPASFGTSPAAARTSGLVALIRQQKPDINPGSVKDLLIRTAEDKSGADGPDTDLLYPEDHATWDNRWGFGETDAYRALAAVTGQDEAIQRTNLTFLNSDGSAHPSDPWYDSDAITTQRLEEGFWIEEGEPDTIIVKIVNLGLNPAYRVKVSFGFYPFTAGIPKFQDIGAMLIERIDPGEANAIDLPYDWTPPDLPDGEEHGCLLVSIDYGYDTTFSGRSNVAQKNIQVRPASSPAEFTFRVENTLLTEAKIELKAREEHGNWTLKLSETAFDMKPHDCARIISATIEPSTGIKPGEEVVFHVSAFATPMGEKEKRVEIGGVALKARYEGKKPIPWGWAIAVFVTILVVFFIFLRRRKSRAI